MKPKNYLLVAGIFLAALVNGFGQQSTDALPDAAQASVTGTLGVATQRAVVNFAELARKEALARASASLGGTSSSPPVIADGKDRGPSGSGGPGSDWPLGSEMYSPLLAASFPALTDIGEAEVPDTHGAVGPSHVMTVHNFRVHIQDRSGNVISTVSLTNFWAPLGPFPPRAFNNRVYPGVTDPKVFYQPFDRRWVKVAITADTAGTNSALLIGVSQSTDPTGNWNLYRIDTDPANLLFLDFPNLGFNKDWIAVQGHIIRISDGTLLRSDIFVFNKTNLYAGGAGLFTRIQRTDLGGVFSRLPQPAITFDDQLSTLYLLGQVDSGSGVNLNQLRLFTITGPVRAEVFTVGPLITTTNRWNNLSAAGFADFAPQFGSVQKVDIIDAIVPALVYRNGSLWAVQNVFLPAGGAPKRTSVQWWQISPQGAVLQRGLIDDRSGQNFYGYPSVAVNKFNDVLIGYSRFSTNQYASANYSFRAGNDPPNTLCSDTVFKVGEAPYYQPVAGHNRWGDFSATVVDPVNDLDLWTIQEYAATPSGGHDRWGTWWGRISPIRVEAVEISGVDVLIRFTTAPDQTYRVERTDNLAAQIIWEPLPGQTNVAGTGSAVAVLDNGAANQPQRFYRVRLN